MQRIWRGSTQQVIYTFMVLDSIKIQSVVRMFVLRRRYLKLLASHLKPLQAPG